MSVVVPSSAATWKFKFLRSRDTLDMNCDSVLADKARDRAIAEILEEVKGVEAA